jgi:hypothetical protein
VKGVPEGAKIYYKGALVTMNPFPVDRGDTIVPVVVEADGFERFALSIVPSENRVLNVVLTPKAQVSESSSLQLESNLKINSKNESPKIADKIKGSGKSPSTGKQKKMPIEKAQSHNFEKGRAGAEFVNTFE